MVELRSYYRDQLIYDDFFIELISGQYGTRVHTPEWVFGSDWVSEGQTGSVIR